MSSAQSRLDRAIAAHERAEAEVERLSDIIQRAADALGKARQTKWEAQKELDEAARAARAARAASLPGHAVANGQQPLQGQSGKVRFAPRAASGANNAEDNADELESDYSDEESEGEEYSSEEESEGEEEHDDEDGFDIGNEALQQIRYRLEVAKIDPNSPEGTKLLDELLVRLQNTDEEVIDAGMVNEFIDELLFDAEEQDGPQNTNERAEQMNRKVQQQPPPPQNPQQQPRIRINRNGKVLGWYQGDLDERGYAREGKGSMYYDAGHECHGTWKNDEMIGRGIYQWSDGHVYDGEWLNGKRHGLGRFIRPDNVVLYGRYEKGHHKGEGVRWSADRKEAQVVVDGVPKKSVSLSKAKEIAANIGFDELLPPV